MIYYAELDLEQHRALELIEAGRNVFLSGGAGSGKSYALEKLKYNCANRNVIYLAPTGIAALNIGGMTIHRFFEFTDSITDLLENKTYSASKLEVFRRIACIVIDEISMVSALLLDAIDKTLRRVRNSDQPFGSVAIVAAGDFQQLKPIITDDLKATLDRTYHGYYAFCAKAWKAANFQTIELTGNYRQKEDKLYSSILRHIRDFTPEVGEAIDHLNSLQAKRKAEDKPPDPFVISLCARNRDAAIINKQQLDSLPGKKFSYAADITGVLYEDNYPVDTMLELKVGAKVMFTQNNPPNYVNGTIGYVVSLDNDKIMVELESGGVLRVPQYTWEDKEYEYSEFEGITKVHSKTVGVMTQYPLRLAWAISVHKSQGMSLNAANIILGDGAFAEGQLYVALSRIRSLAGLRQLDKTIDCFELSPNPMVKAFYEGTLEQV
jgi:ATP-dependent exoDNAse (exonuclease V) alpha subunit